MTVYAVLPVFNRLSLTQVHISCLRKQIINQHLHILVIDDGSTDGTGEWLRSQYDVEVLNGNGALFWGGAVDLALRHLRGRAASEDWVLLVNNDTKMDEDFIQQLLDAAKTHAPAAVGSVIRDESNHARLLSFGVYVDAWRMLTGDLLDKLALDQRGALTEVVALSGRGALYPMAALVAAGGMRPAMLPHYLADYELSLRISRLGWSLFILPSAAVYSSDDYGSSCYPSTFFDKLFSVRSPLYLPAFLSFWWGVSGWFQRFTMPFRLLLFLLFPYFRKIRL